MIIGDLAIGNAAGSTRLGLLGTGRIDILGRVSASGTGRTIQIGGSTGNANPADPTTMADVIRMAPMSSGGGRLILGQVALDLRGAKIGVGLDGGFLVPLGLTPGGTPASTETVEKDWIGNPKSTLYGIPGGYADPVVISAGSLKVTYSDYALFQNTGDRGAPSGVNAEVLSIASSGAQGNAFELFGTIREIGGPPASLLVQPVEVSMGTSRVNGCLIVTGAGCGGAGPTTIPQNPTLNPPPTPEPPPGPEVFGGATELAFQDLVSTDENEALNFDSLVGTNNEGLLGALGVDDTGAQCAPDDTRDICRSKENPNEQ
jgi:hypothetical protein